MDTTTFSYATGKRVFDFVAALVALVLLSPLLLLVAVIIKIESKGPVIYKSKRVGRHYKIFDFLKFRTMDANADQNLRKELNQYADVSAQIVQQTDECPFCKVLSRNCSPMLLHDEGVICENFYELKKERAQTFYKIKNDPRVTRFGHFLRRTSIDELPQLINILQGDMSVIGNRPLPLYEAEQLTTDDSIKRFDSPAGLTGLWQVTQRGTNHVTARDRIDLDIKYARTWSLLTDFKILIRTFPAVIQKEKV